MNIGNSMHPTPTAPRTVQDMVNELYAATKHYNSYEPIMTVYERQIAHESLMEKRREYRAVIVKALEEDRKQHEADLEKASQGVQRAKVKEIARWDPQRLNAAMENTERLVKLALQPMLDGPRTAERLRAIREEAAASGDIFKVRAAGEVLQAAVDRIPSGERAEAVHVVFDAKRDLEALRNTAEMQAAREAEAEALAVKQEGERTAEAVMELVSLGREETQARIEEILERSNAIWKPENKAPGN